MAFIREHVLLFVLIFACLVTFLWLLRFRERLRMTWWAALLVSVACVMLGVFTVRIFARFEGADAGAMSIFGAVFLMPLFLFLGAKLFHRPTSEVFDILTIPMLFTLCCSRISCLVSGCCFGLQIGSTQLRWPTREAEMLYYIVFILIFAPKVIKGGTGGKIYPLYMASYGAFRALIEFFRYSSGSSILHLAHLWAALALLAGLVIYLDLADQGKKRKKARKS